MKTAAVISQADGQTVHLPLDIHLDGAEVYVKQIGASVVLIPKQHNPWQSLVESLDQFTDDFMQDRVQPQQTRPAELFQ